MVIAQLVQARSTSTSRTRISASTVVLAVMVNAQLALLANIGMATEQISAFGAALVQLGIARQVLAKYMRNNN